MLPTPDVSNNVSERKQRLSCKGSTNSSTNWYDEDVPRLPPGQTTNMRRISPILVTLLAVALLVGSIGFVPARPPAQDTTARTEAKDASEAFFNEGRIPELRIQLKPAQLEALQNDN